MNLLEIINYIVSHGERKIYEIQNSTQISYCVRKETDSSTSARIVATFFENWFAFTIFCHDNFKKTGKVATFFNSDSFPVNKKEVDEVIELINDCGVIVDFLEEC